MKEKIVLEEMHLIHDCKQKTYGKAKQIVWNRSLNQTTKVQKLFDKDFTKARCRFHITNFNLVCKIC